MGRLIQTSLPSIQLKPICTKREQIEEKEQNQREKSKELHDRHARPLIPLQPSEMVYIRDMQRQGTVVKEVAPRSYLVQTSTGAIRRNRGALVKVPTPTEADNNQATAEESIPPEDTHRGHTREDPVSAEHQAVPDSPLATHGPRVSDGAVAEGRAIRHSPQARLPPSGKVIERPQRSRRQPSRFRDYVMS